MTKPLYSEGWINSWAPPRLDDCIFYHKMDLPGHGTLGHEDAWDLRNRFEDYTGHVDVSGRTFLDVGSASGFISFEAEKRGAVVTSFDLDFGFRRQPVPKASIGDLPKFIESSDDYYWRMKNAYWLSHAAFHSSARVFYGDIYRFPADFGPFDIAFVGQLLVHLRDPAGALMNIASVCDDLLVITEGMFESDKPFAVFLSGPDSSNYDAWWHYSTKMYEDLLAILGFKICSITRNSYWTAHPRLKGGVEVPTIVAKRVSARRSAKDSIGV
ncbi:MAG: class I SAM-dependent methyltransferase [Beijerinckiaceae bacterium]